VAGARLGEILIPAEDGRRFTSSTARAAICAVDALTGVNLHVFGYNPTGRVAS
jgi:hypothetical protein